MIKEFFNEIKSILSTAKNDLISEFPDFNKDFLFNLQKKQSDLLELSDIKSRKISTQKKEITESNNDSIDYLLVNEGLLSNSKES